MVFPHVTCSGVTNKFLPGMTLMVDWVLNILVSIIVLGIHSSWPRVEPLYGQGKTQHVCDLAQCICAVFDGQVVVRLCFRLIFESAKIAALHIITLLLYWLFFLLILSFYWYFFLTVLFHKKKIFIVFFLLSFFLFIGKLEAEVTGCILKKEKEKNAQRLEQECFHVDRIKNKKKVEEKVLFKLNCHFLLCPWLFFLFLVFRVLNDFFLSSGHLVYFSVLLFFMW